MRPLANELIIRVPHWDVLLFNRQVLTICKYIAGRIKLASHSYLFGCLLTSNWEGWTRVPCFSAAARFPNSMPPPRSPLSVGVVSSCACLVLPTTCTSPPHITAFKQGDTEGNRPDFCSSLVQSPTHTTPLRLAKHSISFEAKGKRLLVVSGYKLGILGDRNLLVFNLMANLEKMPKQLPDGLKAGTWLPRHFLIYLLN